MSAQPLLTKIDEWTVDDLASLPEDGRRFEIVDGSLLVTPPPSNQHQSVARRLTRLIEDVATPDFEVLSPGSVQIGRSLRVPDVVVLRRSAVAPGTPIAADPTDVLLAVEVMSPGSRHEDRLSKPAHYAEAGIPHFWRFEPEEPTLHVYRLESPAPTYRHVGSWTGHELVELTEPFPIRLVPGSLLPG